MLAVGFAVYFLHLGLQIMFYTLPGSIV